MAVVGTAARGVIIYQLDNQPQEFKRMESPLKYQVIAVIHLYTFRRCLLFNSMYILFLQLLVINNNARTMFMVLSS